MSAIPEVDWKYMRGLHDSLLETLCARINARTLELLHDETLSQHERYGEVFGHIRASDRIIADCFDDWGRSNLWMSLLFLSKHSLLTPEHLAGLTEQTRAMIERDRRPWPEETEEGTAP